MSDINCDSFTSIQHLLPPSPVESSMALVVTASSCKTPGNLDASQGERSGLGLSMAVAIPQ